MFDLGNAIKDWLKENPDITNQIGNKIYNVVVVTSEKVVNPPYLVVAVDSVTPVYSKDLFIYNEASFTVAVLALKYSELTDYSKLVRTAIENKEIETDVIEVTSISFDNYSEGFDTNFELYNSSLKFSCKYLNK